VENQGGRYEDRAIDKEDSGGRNNQAIEGACKKPEEFDFQRVEWEKGVQSRQDARVRALIDCERKESIRT